MNKKWNEWCKWCEDIFEIWGVRKDEILDYSMKCRQQRKEDGHFFMCGDCANKTVCAYYFNDYISNDIRKELRKIKWKV